MVTPIIPLVSGVVSVFFGTLMYFNMRHAVDLINLRAEVSSISILIESQSAGELSDESDVEIKDSIRELTEVHLGHIRKDLQELRRLESIRRCSDSLNFESKSESQSLLSAEFMNYADSFLGARILSTECNPVVQESKLFKWFGSASFNEQNSQNILHPNMKPGSCFAFKGHEATVTILLTANIQIEALELQHISKYESPSKETSSAPRHFGAFGIDSTDGLFHLGDFEYENLKTFQVFPVHTDNVCRRLRLHFRTNHGNPTFTCVYRVSVYGKPN